MIQLFDYIKLIFSKDEKSWNELSNTDKSRNFFMLNRFLSIQFPIQVAALSSIRIDSVATSDYWHRSLSSKFTKVPNWIYAKTIKANKEKKIEFPSKEMINWYCEKNEISYAEYDQTVKFFGDKFLDEQKKLEKVLKSQGVLSIKE